MKDTQEKSRKKQNDFADVNAIRWIEERNRQLVSFTVIFACQRCVTFLTEWTTFRKSSLATRGRAENVVATDAQDDCLCMAED